MATYRELRVYQDSYKLAVEVHTLSLDLPKYLQFDLADQLRRSSRSIPSNIAEGYGRSQSARDIKHFLSLALGSTDEMLFNLVFLQDCRLLKTERCVSLTERYSIIGKQLKQLYRSLQIQVTRQPDNEITRQTT